MLLDILSRLRFEPLQVEQVVDHRRKYQLDLDPRFPLAVKPVSFVPTASSQRFNWHERLELFIVADGRGRFRMGEQLIPFAPGDILVVDNLKLHGLEDCRGPLRRGVVVTFMPELVCSPSSHACDLVYLLPFYARPASLVPAVRTSDPHYCGVQSALGSLIQSYFSGPGTGPQAATKAHLLEALYALAEHFGIAGSPVEAGEARRRQSLRFGRLWEHLRENCAEPISVPEAARMAGLTESQFMRSFKSATGTTFVTYVNQLRLANAHRLLTETRLSIAEIASKVGFADQSYFDRRFRAMYKRSPREARVAATIG